MTARRKFKRTNWDVLEAPDLWVDDFQITKLVVPISDSYWLSWYQILMIFVSVLQLSVKGLERISCGNSVASVTVTIMNTGQEI